MGQNGIARAPTVKLDCPEFIKGGATFLLDSGAELNIVKRSRLVQTLYGDASVKYDLIGITPTPVTTRGQIFLTIADRVVPFQVVRDEEFAIKEDAILGSRFFYDEGVEISYKDKALKIGDFHIPFYHGEYTLLPARCKKLVYVRVANFQPDGVGLLERVKTAEHIYLGQSIVSVHNGIAYTYAFNTSPNPVSIPTPVVELIPLDEEELEQLNQQAEVKTTRVEPWNERAKRILELVELDHLDDYERDTIVNLINHNTDLFHLKGDVLTTTNAAEHTIELIDPTPVKARRFKYAPCQKREINRQIEEMLAQGIIRPSRSSFSSPVFLVGKKPGPDGQQAFRLVVDYRLLNNNTVKSQYPLPDIETIINSLSKAQYFTTIDLYSSFHQIPMAEKDIHKTAFSVENGFYEHLRMPFGLCTAPNTFQSMMDSVLAGLIDNELYVFLDDTIIFARTLEEHHRRFSRFADRMRKANLKIKPEKCAFLRRSVTYLGHTISDKGVGPCPKKIEALKSYPVPTSAKKIKQYHGLVNYYRKFIENFAQIAKPLTKLLKTGVPFEWTDEQQTAFETLRDKLINYTTLQYPDYQNEFFLTCDASSYAVGAVLSQITDGQDRPIAYASRTLNDSEKRYHTTERELLAIIYGVQHFRPYLLGQDFTIITDHQPLQWLQNFKDPGARLARWKFILSEYQYKIKYKPGKTNYVADALSRNPPEQPINEKAEIKRYKRRHKTGTTSSSQSGSGKPEKKRPREQVHSSDNMSLTSTESAPRKRGRPRKVPQKPEETTDESNTEEGVFKRPLPIIQPKRRGRPPKKPPTETTEDSSEESNTEVKLPNHPVTRSQRKNQEEEKLRQEKERTKEQSDPDAIEEFDETRHRDRIAPWRPETQKFTDARPYTHEVRFPILKQPPPPSPTSNPVPSTSKPDPIPQDPRGRPKIDKETLIKLNSEEIRRLKTSSGESNQETESEFRTNKPQIRLELNHADNVRITKLPILNEAMHIAFLIASDGMIRTPAQTLLAASGLIRETKLREMNLKEGSMVTSREANATLYGLIIKKNWYDKPDLSLINSALIELRGKIKYESTPIIHLGIDTEIVPKSTWSEIIKSIRLYFFDTKIMFYLHDGREQIETPPQPPEAQKEVQETEPTIDLTPETDHPQNINSTVIPNANDQPINIPFDPGPQIAPHLSPDVIIEQPTQTDNSDERHANQGLSDFEFPSLSYEEPLVVTQLPNFNNTDVEMHSLPDDPSNRSVSSQLSNETPPLTNQPESQNEQDRTPNAASSVVEADQTIFAEHNHVAFFMTADCDTSPEAMKVLKEKEFINKQLILAQKPEPGEVITLKRGSTFYFALVIKRKINTLMNPHDLFDTLKTLKSLLQKNKILEVLVPYDTQTIDNDVWQVIKRAIDLTFRDTAILFVICTKQLIVPDVTIRPQILEEYHCSKANGHRGVKTTLRKISQKFYWKNMRDDVTSFL